MKKTDSNESLVSESGLLLGSEPLGNSPTRLYADGKDQDLTDSEDEDSSDADGGDADGADGDEGDEDSTDADGKD